LYHERGLIPAAEWHTRQRGNLLPGRCPERGLAGLPRASRQATPGFAQAREGKLRSHSIQIGDQRRELQVVDRGAVAVALLNLLGDTEPTEAAADQLAALLPADVECLVTPEVKAVPLAHAMSVRTGLPYVVARKTVKPYMVTPVVREVVSITTGKPQLLVLDGADVERLAGRRVAIVADVVSTGGTPDGLKDLLHSV